MLNQQKNNSEWGDAVMEILSRGINKPKSGHDAGMYDWRRLIQF